MENNDPTKCLLQELIMFFEMTSQSKSNIPLSYTLFVDLIIANIPEIQYPHFSHTYHRQLATLVKTKKSNIYNKRLPSIVLIIRSTETLPKCDKFPARYTVTENWIWANMETFETICNRIWILYENLVWHTSLLYFLENVDVKTTWEYASIT